MFRPPSNVSKADFIGEFSTFVECAALTCCENIILNLHLDKQDVWLLLPLFSDLCLDPLPMSPKPTLLGNSALLLSVLLSVRNRSKKSESINR